MYESDSGVERLTCKDSEKATVLCNFFSSVYTAEPVTEFDELPSRVCDKPMETIQFTDEDILHRLKKLNVNKSPGPDGLHPRILYEICLLYTSPSPRD